MGQMAVLVVVEDNLAFQAMQVWAGQVTRHLQAQAKEIMAHQVHLQLFLVVAVVAAQARSAALQLLIVVVMVVQELRHLLLDQVLLMRVAAAVRELHLVLVLLQELAVLVVVVMAVTCLILHQHQEIQILAVEVAVVDMTIRYLWAVMAVQALLLFLIHLQILI